MTKKIEAIIPEERQSGQDADGIGIVGLNIIQVRGRGRDGGIRIEGARGVHHRPDPKIQTNIVLSDDNVGPPSTPSGGSVHRLER